MYSYSQRLSWSFSTNSLTQLLIDKRTANIPLFDLTASSPTQCVPDYPHRRIQQTFGQIQDFSYWPDPFGSDQARSAIASYYQKHGLSITPHQLLLTASTSEAYTLLFKLLCDPGDEVLTPLPSYPLFDYLAALECVRLTPYRLRYDGAWHLDFSSLRAQINERTRAIIIVNPNNPTGTFLTSAERKNLLQLAAEFRLPIISDEVFTDYPVTTEIQFEKTIADNEDVLSFSLNGLSKAAGMPQMKLAWIAIGGPAKDRQTARERLEIIADTYLSVGTPVQQALPGLLEIGVSVREHLLRTIRRNVAVVDQLIQGTSIQRLRLDGGWSAILQLPRIMTEESWVRQLLLEGNVLVQPGYFFDMESEAYIVLSLITPEDRLAGGMESICAQVARY